MAVLPLELVDKIIDLLAGDRSSLLYCSRLARLWRPRALNHLYRSIRIRQPHLAGNTAGGVVSLTSRQFPKFRTALPHLLLCVRELTVAVEQPREPFDDLVHFVRSASFPPPCAVTTFRITTVGVVGWGQRPFYNFATRFPALRRVELDTQVLFHLTDIADVLAVAQELVLYAIDLDQSMPMSITHLFPEEPIVMPRLRSLEIVNDPTVLNRPFFFYLSRLLEYAPNNERVIVRGGLSPSQYDLSSFFLATRTFRRSISEITMHTDLKPPLKPEHIDSLLANCPRLRVLEIKVEQNSFAPVALPAPLVHRSMTARFTYRGLAYGYLAGLPDAAWDAWIAESLGARLCFVFVIVGGPAASWCAVMEALLKARFPVAYCAGNLQWHVVDK